MTVVAYGVDHGVDGLLNVVKGHGKTLDTLTWLENRTNKAVF